MKGKNKLTPQEERVRLALYRQGLSDSEIARRVGVSRCSIAQWRRRRGLAPNFPPRVLTREEEEKRLALYLSGYSDREIANRLGRSKHCIAQWRIKRGLPAHSGRRGLALWQQRAIALYFRHKDWRWEELAWESFKLQAANRSVRRVGDKVVVVEWYRWRGKTFKRYRVYRDGRLVEVKVDLPGKYVADVRATVGRYLATMCREMEGCPYKPLLPEWSGDDK